MSITPADLKEFHAFAIGQIGNGCAELSLEELVVTWNASRESEDANAGIRRGLADVEAGRYRELDEFMDEFRRDHNIPSDA